jgi:DDE_Tnp_1-associated
VPSGQLGVVTVADARQCVAGRDLGRALRRRGIGLPPGPLDVAESTSLLQALAGVPDPRKARGRRHGLRSMLLLTVGAVLAGARSCAAIAQWAVHAEQAVAVVGPTPHATTFSKSH